MASKNKQAKTDKKNHPGRDGKFLKESNKLKRIAFYNSTTRKKLRKIDHIIEETTIQEYNGRKYRIIKNWEIFPLDVFNALFRWDIIRTGIFDINVLGSDFLAERINDSEIKLCEIEYI